MNQNHQLPQIIEATTPTTPIYDSLTLKKALEWELSLDKCDLRSHAWYYGSISRQYAEELLKKDEDFLVRDCVSQPGNYVLTCMAKGAILHFVINKVSLVSSFDKVFRDRPLEQGERGFLVFGVVES